MTWRPATELVQDVVSEDDLAELREELVGWMGPSVRQDDATISRLYASPNPHFKKVAKDYEERKHQARTLPLIIPTLVEMNAVWRFQNYGYQFKFPSGTILCWWPRTGAVDWQGRKLPNLGQPVDRTIEGWLKLFQEFRDEPLPESSSVPTGEVLVEMVLACLVCGEPNIEQNCAECGRKQTDLCAVCFPRAHWCPTKRTA